MPTVNLGRVRPIHKGTYSAVTTYVPLDMVTYLGSTYFCIQDSTGVTPAVGLYWQLIAETGLQPSNNLSDVDDAATARSNLGLSTVLQSSNNLSDVDNAATARSNLGLSDVLQSSNNLSDVADSATARLNLGLSTVSAPNLIINGDGWVNQRTYVSGTATAAANQFTLDRWFVVTSGQSLTFTGTDAGRVMTAPAGGVSQVIEGRNVAGGTYVINWTGTSTCTVNGTARAKGESFTLPANTNATVRFSDGTFSEAQLELGTESTPFERVGIAAELVKCQRYYMRGLGADLSGVPPIGGATNTRRFYIDFPTQMRAAPTVSGQFASNIGVLTVPTATEHYVRLAGDAGADVECIMNGFMALDAEMTS